MMLTKLHLLNFVLVIFLLPTSKILSNAIAGRCYFCSQNTLAECVGSVQADSMLFNTVLQYYTEPCNGQCVLFRNDQSSTIRGCSWTYGHMTPKSNGWHELSSGIQAYFCDSYLCNNGTFEQPVAAPIPILPIEINQEEFIFTPTQTISPQQLFILGGQTIPDIQTNRDLPIINDIPRQLRQCYVCTSRVTGCAEYLDSRFASKYIQPCPSSCVIFRNPIDHNLITRDCAAAWPDVHAKSGLHKILGSDAFFCQESLCNGIGFDFIMGIFHNQLPAIITFPPTEPIDDISTIIVNPFDLMPITPVTEPIDDTTTIVIENDNVPWEDPDLDFVMAEATTTPPPPSPPPSTTTTTATTTTSTTTISSSTPLSTEILDDNDDEVVDMEFEDESTTASSDFVEHFEFIDNIPASSTIAGGAAVAEENSQFNWWEIDEMTFPPSTQPINSEPITSNSLPPISLINIDEDDWAIFNTTSTPIHPSQENPEMDFNMNDFFPFPFFSSSTPSINFFSNQYSGNPLFDFNKPSPTLAIPPFTWMLQQLANGNQTHRNSTMKIKGKIISTEYLDYCKKKQCRHGGRLNADCLCICLPAFSGNNCERIDCEQEPAHICDFVLENECKNDSIRYLCPKFCQLNICSSNKSS